MRTLVSPVLASGKLKLMADNMDELFARAVETKEILDAKDMRKFTLDAIATSGFGIESTLSKTQTAYSEELL